MSTRKYLGIATAIGVAGVLFSGYLSITRMTSGVCAFDEPCPFVLGFPACYIGFALFSTLFLISAFAFVAKQKSLWPMAANSAVAFAGVVFAGWMTAKELPAHAGYRLGLPTCAYGFVFFLAMLVLSFSVWIGRSRQRSFA